MFDIDKIGFDNMFFVDKKEDVNILVKAILSDIASKNTPIYSECVEYFNSFLLPVKSTEFLPLSYSTTNKKLCDVELRANLNTISFIKNNNLLDFANIKIGDAIKQLTVGLNNLPVSIYNLNTNNYIKVSDVVKSSNNGFSFYYKESDFDDELFYVNVSKLCIIDSNNKITFTNVNNHNSRKENSFPKKHNNNILVGNKTLIANIEIIGIPNNSNTKNTKNTKNTNTQQNNKLIYEYADLPSNICAKVDFNNKILIPNKNNIYVIKASKCKPNPEINGPLFTDAMIRLSEQVRNILDDKLIDEWFYPTDSEELKHQYNSDLKLFIINEKCISFFQNDKTINKLMNLPTIN